MAGFLDPKQRVMDVILTEIGRQQMTKGEFDVKFVSFSDAGVDYKDDGNGVLEPIDDKLFFEAYSMASDEIIPEIDSDGKFIIDQKLPGTLVVRDGILYEEDPVTSTYKEINGYTNVLTFADTTIKRFNSLQILNTITAVEDFSVNVTNFPVAAIEQTTEPPISVEDLLPLAVDPKFENQINMRYLPPFFEIGDEQTLLRSFNKWTDTEGNSVDVMNTENLKRRIEEINQSTIEGTSRTRITFGKIETDDYLEYNILGQVFVGKEQSLKKYTIIDAGEFFDEENTPVARIYFLGFLYKDSLGITKFAREFSLVFNNGDV